MRKIVQIEELRYGRRESYDEAALDEMIECFKDDLDDEIPQASLSPFYPLIERTLYQFDKGKLIGSKRTFYLLGQEIRDQKYVEWYPDWNKEALTVFYDAKRDEYVVRHIRYEVDKSTPRFNSQALAEADYPRKSKDIQAPVEEQLVSFLPPKPQQPEPKKTQPSVSSTPSIPTTEYRKPWRQKRLAQLMSYYKQGYTAKEIAAEMECLESSVYYQLENYLNVHNPFQGGWISRQEAAKKERKREESYTKRTQPEREPQDHRPKKRGEYYKDLFRNMRRAKNEFGERAPHKVILLLTVMRRYRSYTGYTITKDINLQLAFMDCWNQYVQSSHWTPNLNMPWEHMTTEPFWHQASNPKQATIDLQLQKLFIDKASRKELKEALISML